jgi:hypothetical protein
MDSLCTPFEYYAELEASKFHAFHHQIQCPELPQTCLSLHPFCCHLTVESTNLPQDIYVARISSGVAMSIVLTYFVELCPFACAGAARHVLMFVDWLCSVVGRHEVC